MASKASASLVQSGGGSMEGTGGGRLTDTGDIQYGCFQTYADNDRR